MRQCLPLAADVFANARIHSPRSLFSMPKCSPMTEFRLAALGGITKRM
jgi:hypothetical protein